MISSFTDIKDRIEVCSLSRRSKKSCNTSFKITKSLTAGTTFDYSETSGNEIPSSGIGNYWTILGRGMFMPATHRDYLEDGQPGQGT